MTTTALRLDGIVKRFGALVAVDDVSLDLADGELLALVGPSGCGKSTLLRLAAGLLALDEGTITLGGTVVDDGRRHLPPERRRVGLVFQEHALFPHLTVARNIAFGLRTGDRSERRARIDEVLSLVGLGALRDRYPHELSGGERQRVALARAIAPEPTLLLLDEPFASLDPNLRSQIRADVVDILRRTGTPGVFVTHDQEEALAVGDRVAVMRGGHIMALGTPWEVFHRPADTFCASFMGEASFLPVQPAGDGFETCLGPVEVRDLDPDRVLAMARPDDLVISNAGSGTAAIVAREFRGSEWRYDIDLDDGCSVAVVCSHLVDLAVGSRVEVTLRDGHRLVAVVADDA